MTHFLSKSKILSGLQCQKRLWLEKHRPDLAEVDNAADRRMQAGNTVGEIAWDLFPGGHLIEMDRGLSNAVEETRTLLANSPVPPLFEATFSHGNVLVRADITTKEDKGVRLTEVKSSTSVKEYHLSDCATQLWVVENAGYPVLEVNVAVVDNTFVYPGGGDYEGLLRLEDVTQQARALKTEVTQWVHTFQKVLAEKEPNVEPGSQCSDPFGCPFQGHCSPEEGPKYPLSCLPRARSALIESLEDEGYQDIRDIPDGHLLNEAMERVRRITVSGKPELNPEAGETLRTLPYPRYFLDFETIQFAVPIWKGTRPYEQLPFQWSCHVELVLGQMEHREFLDISGEAPLRGFTESLIQACGDYGPIFVYNAGFEKGRIKEAAGRYPEHKEMLDALLPRIVDLLPITRSNYYHPAMKGSWSIKAVLPCVAPDLDYGQLEGVQHGGDAQEGFLEATASGTTEMKKNKLREQLLAYCKLDTFAMVRLAEFFVQS